MQRGAWTHSCPVPVDRGRECNVIWSDRDELEVLQILVEQQTG